MVQGKFPTYNLSRAAIEGYLNERFYSYRWTAYNFKKQNDNWVFDIPEPLTSGDEEALRALRDPSAQSN